MSEEGLKRLRQSLPEDGKDKTEPQSGMDFLYADKYYWLNPLDTDLQW